MKTTVIDDVTIDRMVPEASMEMLMKTNKLPISDIYDEDKIVFFCAKQVDKTIGVIGIEKCSSTGLLRSLAVDPSFRSVGLGTRLVNAVEDFARKNALHDLYLLTTDAVSYFERRGYKVHTRCNVPAEIERTKQYSALCPAEAVLMSKLL